MKMLELRDELDQAREALAGLEAELGSAREADETESARLKKRLRTAELELEARRLENSALREKVRGLEMLTRNAVTSEPIERQFSALTDQLDRVDEMETRRRQGPNPSTISQGSRSSKDSVRGLPDLRLRCDHPAMTRSSP